MAVVGEVLCSELVVLLVAWGGRKGTIWIEAVLGARCSDPSMHQSLLSKNPLVDTFEHTSQHLMFHQKRYSIT